jgi:hypothetical protein
MESATPECQSLQTAGRLPEGLSASSSVVVNLVRRDGRSISAQMKMDESIKRLAS